ncbi:hypothetical protein SADUNF_Sadunf17G0078200 [Salix dunnii]|uniref:Uncharacterized protein n=1 Tax=Salix dunnii TaxID=1413687 RepID=A0A835J5F1_9ROSI|nr:hypothetical protein SADUNF_Sadunf17G0078200 [Salix dunnii]
MCAISWTTPPFDRISHSLQVFSSGRKLKILFGRTGSQEEVAALSTIPEGLPGSSTLLLVMTPTSSASVPDSVDGRGADASIEAYRHSLRQFRHTLSSFLISNNTSISSRNVGCHGTDGWWLLCPWGEGAIVEEVETDRERATVEGNLMSGISGKKIPGLCAENSGENLLATESKPAEVKMYQDENLMANERESVEKKGSLEMAGKDDEKYQTMDSTSVEI